MASRRGTSNSNQRGNTTDRRRRCEWLVETYRANMDLDLDWFGTGRQRQLWIEVPLGTGIPACRCYRCGKLLTVNTVSPDRIKPGIEGGTYRRNNIRPACERCQSSTGGHLGNARKRAKAGAR
jgi:hypothetical protein